MSQNTSHEQPAPKCMESNRVFIVANKCIFTAIFSHTQVADPLNVFYNSDLTAGQEVACVYPAAGLTAGAQTAVYPADKVFSTYAEADAAWSQIVKRNKPLEKPRPTAADYPMRVVTHSLHS